MTSGCNEKRWQAVGGALYALGGRGHEHFRETGARAGGDSREIPKDVAELLDHRLGVAEIRRAIPAASSLLRLAGFRVSPNKPSNGNAIDPPSLRWSSPTGPAGILVDGQGFELVCHTRSRRSKLELLQRTPSRRPKAGPIGFQFLVLFVCWLGVHIGES